MLRFSANLTMLFTEHDFLDRFAAAASAGFTGVEYVGPYAWPAAEIAGRLRDNGLTQALFNLPAGDWEKGERGIAILPDRVDEFRRGVDLAIDYAGALGCGQVNCLAGLAPPGVDRALLRRTFVDNLRYASARLGEAGIRLLVEPINTIDMPGFFINRADEAVALIDDVGSDNLWLQFDVYHMQIMQGDLTRSLERHVDRIAHIQVADNPGRHEPGTGEINYPFVFRTLERLGYTRWVGAEYRPQAGTMAGLGWMAALT
ncbi:MAG: hydroxypyruvate isomerase [Rhizobiaceae bacterium]